MKTGKGPGGMKTASPKLQVQKKPGGKVGGSNASVKVTPSKKMGGSKKSC